MSINPFFVGGPVPIEYFVGRRSEIQLAFDLITKRSHGAFYGGSGMGKSSLLKILTYPQIWQQQGQDYTKVYVVYLNCTDINPFSPCGFWREILYLLEDEAEDNLQVCINEILQQKIIEKDCLRKILKKIGKQKKFLLLLIDDYDAALCCHNQYSENEMLTFLSEFRNLAVHSREGQYLSTILTTFRRLNELGPKLLPNGSPWYNHYLFQPIKPYSKTQVLREFFSSSSSRCIRISQSLQEGILAIVHGHPALLQNAGHLLHDKLKQGRIPDIERFIQDFQSRTEQIFDNIWKFSTDEEQILMMLIALSSLEGRLGNKKYALGDIERIFSQKARELIDLEERGIIKQIEKEDRSVYVFTSSMMEWWVLKEIENSKEAELEKREKILLKLMSREQAEKFTSVIKLGWKHREAVQPIVKIISKFFGDPT